MVNHTPLLSRRTGAGHEVDRNIRLVPGFRFVEKLHACRLPWIRQLKIRDENDETFMIADFPGHRSCLIAFHPYRPGQVVTYNGGGSVATGSRGGSSRDSRAASTAQSNPGTGTVLAAAATSARRNRIPGKK